MPLRQIDRRKGDEPEGCGWEQRPATREDRYPYRVSGLVQLEVDLLNDTIALCQN
jgi:hypothetical protein